MTVSVIIPALNEAEALADMLPDLCAQHGLAEVIVVDGGSEDATVNVCKKHGAVVIPAPRGRALQMNAGAGVACGDILLFLHADTRLPGEGIALVEEAIFTGAVWGRFDVRLSGRHWLLRVVERMINLRSCVSGIATGDQAIFLCRETFESVGGFTVIPLMEDVELSKRLRKLQWPSCISQPVVTSSRRWEQYGIVRTIVLMWLIRLGYFLGISPQRLMHRYRRSDTAGQGCDAA